jgi:hypothetical protein
VTTPGSGALSLETATAVCEAGERLVGGAGYVENPTTLTPIVAQFLSTAGGLPLTNGSTDPAGYTTQAIVGNGQSVVSQAFCVDES